MSDNPKVTLLAGDAFGKSVGVWRIALALREEAYGLSPPSVIIEAGRQFAPWDDIVERRDDGRLHLWQVKSGSGVTREELEQLVRKLSFELPAADATLASRMDARVAGVSSRLGELERVVSAVRAGGAFETEKLSSWGKFLEEVCGGAAIAESVCRRLHILFLGSLESILPWATRELECIYERDVVPAVLARLLVVVDATLGSAVSTKSLRQTSLLEFEGRRRFAFPEPIESVRASYLRAVQADVRSRRVLRDIRKDGVKLSDVWVDVRLSTPSGEQFGARTLPCRLSGGTVHLLLAPAGGGKTEVLARTAAALADIAAISTEAALPLLIPANALNDFSDRELAACAQTFARGTAPWLKTLLEAPGQRWILLIDGVDEVEHGAEAVDAVQRRFPGATVIVAARPTIGRALDPAVRFKIEAWRVSEAELFMKAMVAVHPEAVEALQGLGAQAGALLDRPLTASLAVVTALHDGRLPASRAQIFRAAVPLLMEDWAARRKIANRWDSVADDVRRLALEIVRGERAIIPASELRALAQRAAPDRSIALQHAAEDDFGLLVPVPGGYEFLLRGLAEHLAGEFLARDDDAVVEAAHSAWGAEPARHALGFLAESNTDRFVRIMRRILSSLDSSSDCSLGALRAFLVAIRTAADVGAKAAGIAVALSEWCCAFLREEYSPWRADRVADAVAELAVAGGPCWNEIRRQIVAILSDPREPADYFGALTDERAETWVQLLFHCDPAVRAEAIRRLEAHVNNPRIINHLVSMLQDVPPFEVQCVPPAIEAGLCLRKADRSGPIAEYIDLLRQMSELGGQLSAAAAAVALRTNEHDANALVRALRDGAHGGYIPERILNELALVPEGASALEAAWPDWHTYRFHTPPAGNLRDARQPIPPSRWVRRRIVRAATVAIARDRALAEALEPLLANGAKDLYLNALCEGGLLSPDAALELLKISPVRFPVLRPRAQELLAPVVIRHAAVRAQILGAWPDFLANAPSRALVFPGKALEPLVIAGDSEAVHVYADWLPYSHHAVGLFAGPSPDPLVFGQTEVRAAGRRIVDRAWRASREGIEDAKGQHVSVAKTSIASVLRHFSPCWRGDEEIAEGVLAWLGSEDVNTRLAGIVALERASLNTDQRKVLLQFVRGALTSTDRLHGVFSMPSAVRLARLHDILSHLVPEILKLVEGEGPATIAAVCAATLVVSASDARRLSEIAAGRRLHLMGFEEIDPEDLGALTALAPNAWAESLVRELGRSGPLILDTLLPIYRALPLPQRRTAAKKLATMTKGCVLPWCSPQIAEEIYRPFDMVQHLLFDCGEV